ncbi:MAG: GAF domain-containing protein [Planctomycetes bacterium]|nr:GAF domain-containing protein [Planctomycetota bacterium]
MNDDPLRSSIDLHDTFLVRLDDVTRQIDVPDELTLAAARLLGEHLSVNRCAYADVEGDQDTFNLLGDYNKDVPSIVGRYRFAQFGEECLRLMRAGEPYIVEDSESDPRTEDVRDSYRLTLIRSVICVSLQKGCRFVAAMAVHQVSPRSWSPDEVELVQRVADRCWESIERMRIGRELRESEARLHAALEAARQVAWERLPVSDTMRCSQSACTVLGIALDDGRIAVTDWQDCIHPDDREQRHAIVDEAQRLGGPYRVEFRWTRPDDGSEMWVEESGRFDRLVGGRESKASGIAADITVRQRQAIREHLLVDATTILTSSLDQEETLRRLAKVVVPRLADWVAIDLRGPDGTLHRLAIEHIDQAKAAEAQEWQRRYPLRQDQAPYTVVGTGSTVLSETITDELLVAASHDSEHLRLVRDLRLNSYMVVPLTGSKRVLGALTLVTAESGRTYTSADVAFAEDLARQAGTAIENSQLFGEAETARCEAAQRAEALAATNAELQQFAYVASHDLKEPLRMVTQYMDILDRKLGPNLSPEHRRFLAFAVDGATRMQALITDLLAFTSAGRDERMSEEVDLQAVIQEVMLVFAEQIAATKASVSIDPLPTLPGSRTRLALVLQNLIGNALKFIARDRPPQIAVSAARRGETWEISVQDNGIGIEPAYHQKVFEVFQRLHARGEYPGTGMGLAICRKIIEQHHGELLVESELGWGSRFILRLPALPDRVIDRAITSDRERNASP